MALKPVREHRQRFFHLPLDVSLRVGMHKHRRPAPTKAVLVDLVELFRLSGKVKGGMMKDRAYPSREADCARASTGSSDHRRETKASSLPLHLSRDLDLVRGFLLEFICPQVGEQPVNRQRALLMPFLPTGKSPHSFRLLGHDRDCRFSCRGCPRWELSSSEPQ